MKKLIYIVMFAVFASGCTSMLARSDLSIPTASTSEYFTTEMVAFNLNRAEKKVQYKLELLVRRELGSGIFLETYFENPIDKNSPLIVFTNVAPDDKRIDIKSPDVHGLRAEHNYEIIVKIYRDESKNELLGEHRQFCRSLMDSSWIE